MGLKEISLADKKKILLNMLIEIDKYCEENDITYFLIGGSLLGAIRHDGFIPWDDDIDIGMPRDDYEIFIKSFSKKSNNLKVFDYRNKEHYIWPAAKVIDDRTELIENGHYKNRIGVYIDVFPFDKVYGNYSQVKKKQRKIKKWKNILDLRSLSVEKNRSVIKNVIIVCGKIFEIIPSKLIIDHIANLSKKDNKYDCKYICNFVGAWGEREIAKTEYFKKIDKHKFENYNFNIPCGYDAYLQTVYGDYMKLPPIDKRVTHHGNVAYWKEK